MSCPRVPMTSSVYQCLVLVSRSLVPYPSDFSCPGDFDTQKYTFFSDFPPPAIRTFASHLKTTCICTGIPNSLRLVKLSRLTLPLEHANP